MTVPSAYKTNLRFSDIFIMVLIYNINKKGPISEPKEH